MDPVALYYPYIHIRDDTWLKYAALYWPKMGRLRPHRYVTQDSPVARALQNEAKWLIDIQPPDWAVVDVGRPFLNLISMNAPTLRGRFGLDRIEDWARIEADMWHRNYGRIFRGTAIRGGGGGSFNSDMLKPLQLDPRMGFVNGEKIESYLVDAAVDAGLAVVFTDMWGLTWIGMHPKLASIYTCALIERIAIENQLHPVTDQILPHSALSGWTLEHLVEVLVDQPLAPTDERRPRDDLSDMFVFLSFETVIPAHLDTVPIEKIIEIRSRFGTELNAFRSYVTDQIQQMAKLQDVRDLPVLHEHLHTEVQRTVITQLAQLREQLRSIGVDSVKALANAKSVTLPPLAAAAANIAGLSPTATGPAALAACILSAPVQWRRKRRSAIRESPIGYLFRIEQALNPPTLIDRLRRSWTER